MREKERERESHVSSKYFFTNRVTRTVDTLATSDDSRDDNEPRRHVPINQSRCRSEGLTGGRKRVSTKEGILSKEEAKTLTGAARRGDKDKDEKKEEGKKKRIERLPVEKGLGAEKSISGNTRLRWIAVEARWNESKRRGRKRRRSERSGRKRINGGG